MSSLRDQPKRGQKTVGGPVVVPTQAEPEPLNLPPAEACDDQHPTLDKRCTCPKGHHAHRSGGDAWSPDLEAIAAELAERDRLRDRVADLETEVDANAAAAREAAATIDRVQKFAAEMRDWCSPHGVAVDYAHRLQEVLGQPPLDLNSLEIDGPCGWGLHCTRCRTTLIASSDGGVEYEFVQRAATGHAQRCPGQHATEPK